MLKAGGTAASWTAALKVGFADLMAAWEFEAVTLGFRTTVLRADVRIRHPIFESCLLEASSGSALAMFGAVSVFVRLGAGTELGGCKSVGTRSLAGVVLTVKGIYPHGTYCLVDMLLITARAPAPPVGGVTRARPGTVPLMPMARATRHEEVDEVVGRHFVRRELN